MHRHIAAIGLLLSATGAAAQPEALSGDAIRETVAGAVFEVDAPLGTRLPVRYADDGTMAADAGSLAFYLGSRTDTGKWWISSDRICQRWSRWFEGATQCLRLAVDGSRVFWRRDDGQTGTATITSRPAPPQRVAAAPEPPRTAPAQHHSSIGAVGALPRIALAPAKPAAEAPATAVARTAPTEPARVARAEPAPAIESPRGQPRTEAPARSVVRRPAETRPAETASLPQRTASAARQPASAATAVSSFIADRPGPDPTYRVIGVDPFDVLNVRNGPSADHRPIGALSPDAHGIRVAQCEPAWCLVTHRSLSGWVNRAFLIADETYRRDQAYAPQ